MARATIVGALVLGSLVAGGCAPDGPPASVIADGSAIVGLAHASAGALSFDYPMAWTLTPVGHTKHYETVLAFLASGSASAAESCGPDYIPGAGAGCADTYGIPPGGVVIRLSQWNLPAPDNKGAAGLVASAIAAGEQPRTVGGQPAADNPAYSDASTPAEGSTVAWFVAGPGGNTVGYAVVATVNGPDPAARAAVEAIVASLKIAPTAP